MGLPVTVYRWDDVGAPQLTTPNPSEIINILQKCLVDGYGSKAPLGWTKEFEDVPNSKVAFRNSPVEGSGGYFQIWSHNSTNDPNTLMRIVSASSMSDLDLFFKKGYISAIHAYNSSIDRWALIGTTRAFYFIVSSNSVTGGNNANYDNMAYIGDFDPFIPTDSNTFIAIGNTGNDGDFLSTSQSSWSYNFNNVFRSSGTTSSAARSSFPLSGTDGSSTVVDYGIYLSNNIFYTNPLQGVTDVNLGIYYPALIGVKNVPPNYNAIDPNGVLYRQSATYPLYRGKLAGLNITMSPRCELQPWPFIQQDFGVDHWVLRSSGYVQATIVNMVTWHD
jgi:hypothetical protein